MNVKKIASLLFFATVCIPSLYSMDNVYTKTAGAGLFAAGVGLIIVGTHNHKDFMRKRKTTYLDNDMMVKKTLYIDEWCTEVLLPISGGALATLSGLLLISSGLDI